MNKFLWVMLMGAAISLGACGSKTTADSGGNAEAGSRVLRGPVEADADSLYGFVAAQVGFGPRVPGSEAHEACRGYIADRLTSYGVDTVAVQTAPVTTWEGKRHTAYNILGRVNPEAKERILLLAHYDTRPWADEDPREENRATPIDGANDGGSGVAVLLEIARKLHEAPLDSLGVDLLFVDLEDSGQSGAGDDRSWCLGVQEWVKSMPYTSGDTPRFGVLLDMVGGKDAIFHREHISQSYAKSVVDKIWALAAASGYSNRFPNSMGGSVIDDHLHINQAGIPCVDIIESYNQYTGSFNPTWHTTADNLASIDRETLKAVTQVVLNLLYREAGHPL